MTRASRDRHGRRRLSLRFLLSAVTLLLHCSTMAHAATVADSAAWRGDPFAGDLIFRYNRVDGAATGARLRWLSSSLPDRSAALEVSYAAARRRALFQLSFAEAMGKAERFRWAAAAYRRTASFALDDERMGNFENTLSALLLADDNRDYFEARGGSASLTWRAPLSTALTIGIRGERQRPLENATDAALFGADPFRENPAATAGTLSALQLAFDHDARGGLEDLGAPILSRQWRPRGYRIRGALETAGAGLGGDFRYATALVEAAVRWPVLSGHSIAARVMAGRAISGRLPPQAEFAAGGATTLRGHAHKSLRGDRLVVMNVEYAATLHRAIEALALIDSGAAWRSDEAPNGVRWGLDGGGGLQTHDQRLRLIVARPLRESEGPWILSLRTRATF